VEKDRIVKKDKNLELKEAVKKKEKGSQ